MKRNLAPSVADILFLIVGPLTVLFRTVKLTHSDGDLAAHIRMGKTILTSGEIPIQSLASFTASDELMVAHGWLSEVLFAWLWGLGRLPLVAATTAITIAATHAAIVLFLRHRGIDPRWALAAGFVSLAISSTHWLARPHMFSIAGVALTIMILESRGPKRLFMVACLFALWANLHGGWAFGLLIMALYPLGRLIESFVSPDTRVESLAAARSDGVLLAVAGAATLINPFGLGLHREVFSAATSSDLARQMGEFMPPDFQAAAALPFLAGLLITTAILGASDRRMPAPHLLLVCVTLALALRSFRNIALFGVSAWPLVALHASTTWRSRIRLPLFREVARLDEGTRPGLYAAPVAALILLLAANGGSAFGTQLIPSGFSARIFPVAAVERARAAGPGDRVFETWRWGGYIMYAWPAARLAVDPLKFNRTTVEAYSTIESAKPGWQDEIRRWDIRTIIVTPDSPLATALAGEKDWMILHEDSTAVVFRPASDTALGRTTY